MSIAIQELAFERDKNGKFTYRDLVNNVTATFTGAHQLSKGTNRDMVQVVQGYTYTEDGVVKSGTVQVHTVTAAEEATSAAHQTAIDAAVNLAKVRLDAVIADAGGNASLAVTNERLRADLDPVIDGSDLLHIP